ncbi:MAG: hypothetical protein B7X72_11420 [Sphingobacteriia bacterium 39-39-8]|nr:MAG: hypothetical protein B7X72_11420 [Sphingobacteriia bacterium 39-39-8]
MQSVAQLPTEGKPATLAMRCAETLPQKQFLQNMDLKMNDSDFIQDISALLKPSLVYDIHASYQIVRSQILEKI